MNTNFQALKMETNGLTHNRVHTEIETIEAIDKVRVREQQRRN